MVHPGVVWMLKAAAPIHIGAGLDRTLLDLLDRQPQLIDGVRNSDLVGVIGGVLLMAAGAFLEDRLPPTVADMALVLGAYETARIWNIVESMTARATVARVSASPSQPVVLPPANETGGGGGSQGESKPEVVVRL